MSTSDSRARRSASAKRESRSRSGSRTGPAASPASRSGHKRRLKEQSAKPAVNVGLTLYVAPGELHGAWLRVVLAEKEIERVRVQVVRPEQHDEDFLVLQPSGETPTLADRTGVVTGATIIAQYLDERYPHPPLMPAEPAPRARARMLMNEFDAVLFPALAELHARNKLPEVCTHALRETGLNFSHRANATHGLCGSRYTLPDAAMAVLLWRLQELRVALPQLGEGFTRYAERLLARSAVKQALA